MLAAIVHAGLSQHARRKGTYPPGWGFGFGGAPLAPRPHRHCTMRSEMHVPVGISGDRDSPLADLSRFHHGRTEPGTGDSMIAGFWNDARLFPPPKDRSGRRAAMSRNEETAVIGTITCLGVRSAFEKCCRRHGHDLSPCAHMLGCTTHGATTLAADTRT
jgi:hypothetical protein